MKTIHALLLGLGTLALGCTAELGDDLGDIEQGSVAQQATAAVTARIVIGSDWGGGYCGSLRVTNGTGTVVKNWRIVMDLQGGTVSNAWNAEFSGTTVDTRVSPAGDWQRTVNANQTIDPQLGFCINRSGTGTVVIQSVEAWDANGALVGVPVGAPAGMPMDSLGGIAAPYSTSGACSVSNQLVGEIYRTVFVELGRFRPGVDIDRENGFLKLTQVGKDRCAARGGCRQLETLLSYQRLTNQSRDPLVADFPWMAYWDEGTLIGRWQTKWNGDMANPRPEQMPEHEVRAKVVKVRTDLCSGAKYHCFEVISGNVDAIITGLKAMLHEEMVALVDAHKSPEGWLCIDPTGAPGDTTVTDNLGNVCVDGTIPQLATVYQTGTCCVKADGTLGALKPHARYPQYLVCV